MHSTTWWIFLDWYEQCRILPAGNGLAPWWLAKALKTQIKHCRHGAPLRAYLPDYLPLANAHNSWSIHKIAFSHQAIFPLSCFTPPPFPILWHLPPPWDRPQCGGGSHSGGIGEPVQLLWVHFLFWTKWLQTTSSPFSILSSCPASIIWSENQCQVSKFLPLLQTYRSVLKVLTLYTSIHIVVSMSCVYHRGAWGETTAHDRVLSASFHQLRFSL